MEETRPNLERLFPASLSGRPGDFGAFGPLFRTFFVQRESSLKEVRALLKPSVWKVAGPLWAVHIRKGFSDCSVSGNHCGPPTGSELVHMRKRNPDFDVKRDWSGHGNVTWHAAHCLADALRMHVSSEARIFVASNYAHVWRDFKAAFGLDEDGIPTSMGAFTGKLNGRRVQFKPSITITSGTASNTRKDTKSNQFMFDWLMLTHADALLVHPRTTYSNSALAVARPKTLYVFTGGGPVGSSSSHHVCQELFFRDACMHDGTNVRKLAGRYGDIALGYVSSCDMLGAYR